LERLRTEGLGKRFGAQPALSGVSIGILPGEVHALVGENGAGKSTLIKMITGVYSVDEGRVYWENEPVTIRSPYDASALGIRVIHQDRQLIPSFTGYENLYLGQRYPVSGIARGVRWKEMKARGDALKASLGIEMDLSREAKDMSPSEKTMLEILRAMMDECKLLILDEPTAALTDREAEKLFALIGRLVKQGTSILYVSHRMEEIFRLANRITVLRNGRHVGTVNRDETSRDALVRMMTDAAGPPAESGRRGRARGEAILKVNGLSTEDGKVRGASFTLHKGEILGLFGLAGAGRTELLEAIYGLRAIREGTVEFAGAPLAPSPAFCLAKGIVLIPEDRRGSGMIAGMTIRENMSLPVLDRFASFFRLNHKRERREVGRQMEALQVKATGMDQEIRELSGGNQQKVVFAKAIMSEPAVFLCDEPTQAVDIMTREEIHRLLAGKAEEGCGIIFVSSDLQEVLDVADRIIVMRDGQTVAEMENEGVTAERVLSVCYRSNGEES